MGNYTPVVPEARYYEQVGNPGYYNVYLARADSRRSFYENYLGSAVDAYANEIVIGVRDPEGDTARAIIAQGCARDASVAGRPRVGGSVGLGGNSPNATVSRKFGFLKLVNGRTGKAKVIDLVRSAKRAPR
jgi:hypothetical protein